MALYREATVTLQAIGGGYTQKIGYPIVFYPSGTVGSGPGYTYRALAGGPTTTGTVVAIRSQEPEPAWWPGKDGVMTCRGNVAGDTAYVGGSGIHTAHAEAALVNYTDAPFLSALWDAPGPLDADPISATTIRLPFTGPIVTTGLPSYTVALEDEFLTLAHWEVRNADTNASLGVVSVTAVGDSEVEITITTPMVNGQLYFVRSPTSVYARGTGIVVGGSGLHYPTVDGNYQLVFFTPTDLAGGGDTEPPPPDTDPPPPPDPEEPEDLPDEAGPNLSPFAMSLGVSQGRIRAGGAYVIELGHADRISERFENWDRHRVSQNVPVEASTRLIRAVFLLRAPRKGDTTPATTHNGFVFRAGVGTTVYYRRFIQPNGRDLWIDDVALPVTLAVEGSVPVFYELLLSYGEEEAEA
jgi:hypothetical protein